MVVVVYTDSCSGITVLTFGAMNAAVDLLTTFAKAAVITKRTHTGFAEPAITAKRFFIGEVAIVTAKTMPAVIYIAVLAGHTVPAPYRIGKTFSALVTV